MGPVILSLSEIWVHVHLTCLSPSARAPSVLTPSEIWVHTHPPRSATCKCGGDKTGINDSKLFFKSKVTSRTGKQIIHSSKVLHKLVMSLFSDHFSLQNNCHFSTFLFPFFFFFYALLKINNTITPYTVIQYGGNEKKKRGGWED